jgi:hypothetical protein
MPTIGGIVVATGAEASGRRSLRDIMDELARPIDASDSTIRAIAGDAFRAAVRTMNRKGLWPWELQDEDITQTINSPYTTLTGAVKKPLAMYYLDGNSLPFQRIAYIEYEKLAETYDLSRAGQPTRYSIPNLFETGQIRWYPIPVSAEACRLTYYRVTPAPQVEDEAVEIPDHAIEVYMAFAWYELAKRLPAAQARFPLPFAKADALLAFKELSAHVNMPGDRIQYG